MRIFDEILCGAIVASPKEKFVGKASPKAKNIFPFKSLII